MAVLRLIGFGKKEEFKKVEQVTCKMFYTDYAGINCKTELLIENDINLCIRVKNTLL